jgi:phenylacetate-CoA ligase
MPGVRSFKIVQETLLRTRVLVVPDTVFDDSRRQAIARGVRARLGGAVEVEVEVVPQIPPERSGKHRYVVSHVGVAKSQEPVDA